MKKFISMVMAAAMVVSLVPATAFAANAATFKVVDDIEWTEDEAKSATDIAGPQIQIKVKDVDSKVGKQDEFEITLDYDNAEVITNGWNDGDKWGTAVVYMDGDSSDPVENFDFTLDAAKKGDSSVTVTMTEPSGYDLREGDVIVLPIDSSWGLTKTSKGTVATVEVSGDFGDSDALTVAKVMDYGITVTLKKVATVAVEESTELEKDLKIESNVGKFVDGQKFELKLSSGFEWDKVKENDTLANGLLKVTDVDGKTLEVEFDGTSDTTDELTIAADSVKIEAVSAKAGAVAKITVKAVRGDNKEGFAYTADAVEAAKVVDNEVILSVDEDEDVPVIYSGVNVDNYGITDDSDHISLEVTMEEAAAESLDVKKAFSLSLPDGVYVTNVDVTDIDYKNEAGYSFTDKDIEAKFKSAYEEGENTSFDFKRKTFDETADDGFEIKFELTLIAEPGFEGDVKLTLEGDAFKEAQEVTIAKFVAPYKVEAQANDLIIDYRNTEVPTNVVVKEAEAGLWAKDEMNFIFDIEKMEFEDDATYKADDKSDMEVEAVKGADMGFKVTEESDDTPAEITVSGISLYMERNIPAGAYDLELITAAGTAMMTGVEGKEDNYDAAALFTTDDSGEVKGYYFAADVEDWEYSKDEWEVEADTVKEGFVNIITAGRDQDDASFTKKVVVPVGEKYIVAGDEQIALDVPAYINAAGYTMLPVRAVATALGIKNDNVLWNQETRTVTILYGQRIITMSAGEKVVYVNGSAIPAAAKVEIKDNRTFLPMRDLATALGVTDITWDAATKTATLNGNQK